MKSLWISIFIFFVFLTNVFADEVILKTGEKLEGKIVEQTSKYIKMDPGVGLVMTYYTDDIDTIDGQTVQTAVPAAQPEAQPETQPEPQPEAQPEVQTATQPETQPEAQPESQPAAVPVVPAQVENNFTRPHVIYSTNQRYYSNTSNNSGKDIMCALIFLGIGVFSFFHGLGVLRKKRMIESIPTSTVRGLAIGMVELTGKARKVKTLISPLTRTECTFYRYTIERYESSGKSGRWVLISQGDSVGCPFGLEDGTGHILVLPKGAEFVMPADYTYTTGLGKPLPEELIEFMDKVNITYKSLFGNYTLRFHEWFIKPDEDVFVVGTAQKTTDQLKDIELIQPEVNIDVIIAKGDNSGIFIVSDESQTQVVQGFSWQSFIGIWGGSALSLAMLAYLLFRLGLWAKF